jgi:hypothetical protein
MIGAQRMRLAQEMMLHLKVFDDLRFALKQSVEARDDDQGQHG